jgi:hypothetical protein
MAGLTPAQMAALGAVNGYAAGSNPQAAQSAAIMQGMGGGIAAMNPYAAAFNGLTALGTAALADNTPMTMTAPQTANFDHSGWAVTVGDGSSAQVDQIRTPNPTGAALAQALGGVNPLILLLIVGGGLAFYLASK